MTKFEGIDIVAIGNEVLTGMILNTNARWLSQSLFEKGYTIRRHLTLPDDEQALEKGLKEILSPNRIAITTGGLGPTIDDLSRDRAAHIFESGQHVDKQIEERLIKRYGRPTPALTNQATVPDKALILDNEAGTAPGFVFHSELGTLIMLPGIPGEMRQMFQRQVLPYLEARAPADSRRKRESIRLFNMSESSVDPALREIKSRFPEIELGIYPQAGVLGVTVTGVGIEEPLIHLKTLFKDHLFESESGKIEEALHNLLLKRKKTLSLAESMTGGAAAHRITLMPGCSQYFLGGVVSYSIASKVELLGVDPASIEQYGAVSETVARQMAEGAIKKFKSDYSLAVTGVAGPSGGSDQKPVGLVWCALASQEGTECWMLKGTSAREIIIERGVNSLFSRLVHKLQT